MKKRSRHMGCTEMRWHLKRRPVHFRAGPGGFAPLSWRPWITGRSWRITRRRRKQPGSKVYLTSQTPTLGAEVCALAREKNDRQAMEKLARDVDYAEEPPEALYVLEVGLRQRGAGDAALALLRRAQQAFPADFWINHDLGYALGRSQPPQREEAIRFLTVAVALRPDSPGVRYNLGNALFVARRRDEALVAYRQAIGLKPDYAIAHLKLGWVLGEQGKLDEAIAACRRSIELKSDNADAHFILGDFLDRTGRLDEAIDSYRKAIALKPDYAESHCNLGIALWKQGALKPALFSLERGHELGSRRKDWPYPSAQWVRDCRKQLEADGRLR